MISVSIVTYNTDTDELGKCIASLDSPIVKQIYKEFLEKPGSHVAHDLLHTTYVKREKYK